MEEASEASRQAEKKSTRRTSKLTREQALEIVQQSMREYQAAGGKVEVVPQFWYQGEAYVAIIMPGIRYDDGDFAITGK